MGNISDAGGTTTSFSNTPQTKDDYYTYLEDVLRADVKLYDTTSNTIFLDVMANDLGGKAKSLFSVEDGDGNPLTTDYTLVEMDVNVSGVSGWEATLGGNWVRINDGKVEFRIADGSGVPGQGRSVDSLTAGENFSDQFVYAIRLGNGTLSEATVRINITGANDVAIINADASDDFIVIEAGGNANAIPGDPTASGKLTITDADFGESSFQLPETLDGTYGTFTFNTATGEWTYTLNNNLAATQGLSQGQVVTETLTVVSLDGGTTQPIVVTIYGTNDAPVASDDSGSGNEDALISGSVATNDSDVDDGAALTYSTTSTLAGFTLNPDGSWSLDASNATYQHLAAGASQDYTVDYTVTDEHGASDTAQLVITVHGQNDAPVASDDSGSGNEDALISGSVATNDSDVDDGAALTYSTTSTLAGFTLNPDGSWSLDASNAAYQHLAAGASQDYTVDYTVTDEHGASDTAQLVITVHGQNDAPVASDDSGSGNEDALISGSVATNDSDVDDGAALTYSTTSTLAGFTLNPDGSWSLDASNAAYQHLAAGASQDYTVDYTVTDEHGASDTAQLVITVHGQNDAPVASDDSGSGNEDALISGSVATNDSDVDDGAALTYSTTSTLAGFTLNPDGSWSLDASNAAYQHLAAGASQDYTVDYTVTDEHGASDTAQLVITVHGQNDAPVASDDSGSGNEDALISGSVATNDSDVDDGAALTYSTTSTLAGFTLNPDGSWSLDASNAAYQHLAAGASQDYTVDYTVTDEHGASDTAQLVITVHGQNDAPVASDDSGSGNEDALISGSVATNDSDVDDGAALTYSTTSTLAGFTLNPDGSWSLDASNAAYQHLAAGASQDYTVDYTVTDEHGASDTAQLVITVHGQNDAPVASDDSGSGNEDALISGSVATNDSDVDDGAALTYSTTSTLAGFTLNPDGSWSLDASNAAYQHLAAGASQDYTVDYTVTDEHGASDTAQLVITVHGQNDAPVITSNGGGATAIISVAENTTAVTTVVASDVDSPSLTYSIVGGADASKFTINAATGALSFVTAPNYEAPTDVGGNNVYDVIIQASDGNSVDTQTIAVAVADVPETLITSNDFRFLINTATENEGGGGGGGQNIINNANLGTFQAIGLAGTWTFALVSGQAVPFNISANSLITTSSLSNETHVIQVQATDGSTTIVIPVTVTVGNNGSNTINLGSGTDLAFGIGGNDTINGGDGNDSLSGGSSNDTLNGGAGNDVLWGASGNDILIGGPDADILTGGTGTDTFVLTDSATFDTITDYTAAEIIDISALLTTNGSVSGFVRLTAAGALQLDANGGGDDFVTIAQLTAGINVTVRYSTGSGTATTVISAGAPPIALDLDGDGQISFIGTNGGVEFDYGGGIVSTAWVAANDGLLVRDANGDGDVSSDEIVFATSGSDLDGLQAYDSNADGQLSSADEAFAQFAVWQDSNSDGRVDEGEMHSLSEAGIERISLASDGKTYSTADGDVTVVGTGSYTKLDGSTGVLADAVFATSLRNSQQELRAASSFGGITASIPVFAPELLAPSRFATEHGLNEVERPHFDALQDMHQVGNAYHGLSNEFDYTSMRAALPSNITEERSSHSHALDRLEAEVNPSHIDAAGSSEDRQSEIAPISTEAADPVSSTHGTGVEVSMAAMELVNAMLGLTPEQGPPSAQTEASSFAAVHSENALSIVTEAFADSAIDALLDNLLGSTPASEHALLANVPTAFLSEGMLDHPILADLGYSGIQFAPDVIAADQSQASLAG